uniref:Uncharacterized protein n=1 Tax=Ananas comosus var. bracteatus TaxID=296719 RepID=A0A6V7Q9F8_ANACO|nr:unnamed protein product [Ananas comosus var. bracteatus]
MLKLDYDLLRRFYNSLVAERDRVVADLEKLKENINECFEMINQPNVVPMDEESAANPDGHVMVPSLDHSPTVCGPEHTMLTDEDPIEDTFDRKTRLYLFSSFFLLFLFHPSFCCHLFLFLLGFSICLRRE